MADLSDVTSVKPAAIGHNRAPYDPDYIREGLATDHVTLIRKADKEVAFAAKIPAEFTADNEASFVSDYIKRCTVLVKDMENSRAEAKKPWWNAGLTVDGFFNDYKTKLAEAISRASVPLNAYLQRKAHEEQEARRIEAETLERDRIAAMEAAKGLAEATPEVQHQIIEHAVTMANVAEVAKSVAAAPIITMAESKGNYSRTNLQEEWIGEILSIEALDLNKLRPHFTLKELEKVVDRYVKKGGRELDGAKITKIMGVKVK